MFKEQSGLRDDGPRTVFAIAATRLWRDREGVRVIQA
jgi:hypothetical protein